jgi:RNA polymerase-binding protein DksA
MSQMATNKTTTTKSKIPRERAADKPKWPSGDKPLLYAAEWKEYFREIILEKRKEILRELNYLRETSMDSTADEFAGDNSTYSYHMADQGTDAGEREKAFLFASREGKMLRLLDGALERIDNGTYGYCQETQAPIEFKRLEAIPHARLCIAAKKKNEEENAGRE